MGTYIKSSTGLIRLDQPITSETIKQALGYLPVNFSGNYEDLTNKPIDGGVWTHDSNNFYVVDNNENVIALIDETGVHSIDFDINGKSVNSHLEDKTIHISAEEREKWNDPLSSNDSELYITDKDGNILALFNSDGLTITAIKTTTINGVDADDLANLPQSVADIKSKTDYIEASENDSTFVITDKDNNAIAQFDESGLTVFGINATNIKENGIDIWNQENLQAMTEADINEVVTSVFPPEEYDYNI